MSRTAKKPKPNIHMPESYKFEDRLWWLLAVKGITMSKLAEIIGRNYCDISMYANGKKKPTFDALIAMADYFDVSLDFLMGRSATKDGCVNFFERWKRKDEQQ